MYARLSDCYYLQEVSTCPQMLQLEVQWDYTNKCTFIPNTCIVDIIFPFQYIANSTNWEPILLTFSLLDHHYLNLALQSNRYLPHQKQFRLLLRRRRCVCCFFYGSCEYHILLYLLRVVGLWTLEKSFSRSFGKIAFAILKRVEFRLLRVEFES